MKDNYEYKVFTMGFSASMPESQQESIGGLVQYLEEDGWEVINTTISPNHQNSYYPTLICNARRYNNQNKGNDDE